MCLVVSRRESKCVVPEMLGGEEVRGKIGWMGSGSIDPGFKKEEVDFDSTPCGVGFKQRDDWELVIDGTEDREGYLEKSGNGCFLNAAETEGGRETETNEWCIPG